MDRIRIIEVGPRDGLQNEAAQVPTTVKVAFGIDFELPTEGQ